MRAETRLSKHREAREITNNQQESSMQKTNQKKTKATKVERERKRKKQEGINK